MDIQHVPGKHNVADYLSRILGMEQLELQYLCSISYTCNLCNICHFVDHTGPFDTINSIITIFDESTFL